MKIHIRTSLGAFGYELAADLESKGFNPAVEVGEVDSYELRHAPGMPAKDVAALLKALGPIQPEQIGPDEGLEGADVELWLGDEHWLAERAIAIACDSDELAVRIREAVSGLGLKVQEDNRWLVEEDALLYHEAPVIGRHLVRWLLARQGIRLGEQQTAPWEGDFRVTVRDPQVAGKPWIERAAVRIRADDVDVGQELADQLTAQGFRVEPVEHLPAAEAATAAILLSCGAFNETRAPAQMTRLHVAVQDLVARRGIDTVRYPVRLDQGGADLNATIVLPVQACRAGTKRPYGGPFPERFRFTIYTDQPDAGEGLRQRLQDEGFDQIGIEQVPSLLAQPVASDAGDVPWPFGPQLDGYRITWGAAGKTPPIATSIRAVVEARMRAAGVDREFTLEVQDRFADEDPDVWIFFPAEGGNDGRLWKERMNPRRFNLKMHTPEPGEWQDLASELAEWGWGGFNVVELKAGPLDVSYGGAPRELAERIADMVRERAGVNLVTFQRFDPADPDIFFFVPRRPQPPRPQADRAGAAGGWRGSAQRQAAVLKLKAFGRMLTDMDLSGREPTANAAAFRKLVTTLSKMKRRNAIILGYPGTGKTALVYDLARRMQAQDPSLPERLREQDIFELSPNFFRAGTMYRGQYEERVGELLTVLQANPKMILFIDEIHAMFRSRGELDVYSDAEQSFKGALARGEITCLGCTTYAEYRNAIEPDQALVRRFEIIRLPPPTAEATVRILTARRPRLEKHYAPLRIPDAILERAVALTDDYLPTRFQPDKSLQLLDEACAVCSSAEPPLPEVTEDALFQALEATVGYRLTRASTLTREEVLRRLKEKVIGQDAVLEQVAQAFVTGLGDWRGHSGPRGVFLFAGPTGVGKTETALTLAEILGGGRDALIRIDCNTLHGGEHVATSQLLGVPAGYVGYVRGQGGLLSRVRDRPECVVLFDEFEKADREVGELLLQVIDNGRVEDADGNPLDFRRAFLIFTTNAGVSYDAPGPFGFAATRAVEPERPQVDAETVKAELRERVGLGEEFLGRVTHFFVFQGLTRDVVGRIVDAQLARLGALARDKGFRLEWAPDLVEHLASQWQPRFGVRHLTAILSNRIMEQLSLADVEGALKGVTRIRLQVLTREAAGLFPLPAGTATRRREGKTLVIDLG